MARTKLGASLSDLQRRQQLALRAQTLRQVLRQWSAWDLHDSDSYVALQDALVAITQVNALRSATLAGQFYRTFRLAERPPLAAAVAERVMLAAPPSVEEIRAIIDGAAKSGIYNAFKAGRSYDAAMSNGFVAVSGAIGRVVLNAGRETVIGSVQQDPAALGWARVTADAPCAFCAMLASRGPVYREETVDFQAHDHCVARGTLVNGPLVEIGYRRRFDGEVVVVSVADGHELTITANHPVLTDRGWVPAGLLKVGDQVAQRTRSQRKPVLVPDEQDVPSPIEEVWRALCVNGLVTVPVAAEDFHGDGSGTDGDADVVASDRLFSHECYAEFGEASRQVHSTPARIASVSRSLSRLCDEALMLFAVAVPAPCAGCGVGPGGPLAGGQARAMHGGRFLGAPFGHATIPQPASYYRPGDTARISQGLLRRAGEIRLGQSGRRTKKGGGGPVGPRPRFDPPADERGPQRLRVHADLGRDLLERLAGGVQLSSVSHLRRVKYAGHVFNLQTAEGWYEANGVIVSNCSCSAEPVYRGSEWPGKAQEFRNLWDETGSLKSFRQALTQTE